MREIPQTKNLALKHRRSLLIVLSLLSISFLWYFGYSQTAGYYSATKQASSEVTITVIDLDSNREEIASDNITSSDNSLFALSISQLPNTGMTIQPTVTQLVATSLPVTTVIIKTGVTRTTTPGQTSLPTTVPTSLPKTITTPVPTTSIPTFAPTAIPTLTPTLPDYSKPRQVANGCPATTQACVPCTSGTYCRYEAGYPGHGFLGWSCQNNNPGNIRPAAFKNTIITNNGGTAPCGTRTDADGRGDYMVFASYSAGYNGLKAYLKGIAAGQHSSYTGIVNGVTQTCGECNLKLFASKYAGTTLASQDDASSYANRLANQLGVNADTTMLSWITANNLDGLATAIKNNEGWFVQ